MAPGRATGGHLDHRASVHPRYCLTDTRRACHARRAGSIGRVIMEQRRVVITGIGAITPIGLGVEGLWQGLQRRQSSVRGITRFDPSVFKSRIAGEVDDFWPADHMEGRLSRRL